MAYISTAHSVGDVVYAYCASTDSVRRLRIIGVTAESANASPYSGDWTVRYNAVTASADADRSHVVSDWKEDDLHSDARSAFPEQRPAAYAASDEPATEAA